VRFAQTDARVRLGASWAALGRLADLELAHAVELHQQGGAARGPLAALAAHLTRLSLQARMLDSFSFNPCARARTACCTVLGEEAGSAMQRTARAAQRVGGCVSVARLARRPLACAQGGDARGARPVAELRRHSRTYGPVEGLT